MNIDFASAMPMLDSCDFDEVDLMEAYIKKQVRHATKTLNEKFNTYYERKKRLNESIRELNSSWARLKDHENSLLKRKRELDEKVAEYATRELLMVSELERVNRLWQDETKKRIKLEEEVALLKTKKEVGV